MKHAVHFVDVLKRAAALFLLGGGMVLAGFPEADAQVPGTEVGEHLKAIQQLADEALQASEAAEAAATVEEVKRYADRVYTTVWGIPSGLVDGHTGAERVHGWKTRWQVTGAEFDSAYAARYGTKPPEITDPAQLGIVGRARYVRALLQGTLDEGTASEAERRAATRVITSLNNVIGWMVIDRGFTKGEWQPRVDLTREWDAPMAFWQSTADTGWLHQAAAQALNILKSAYGSDVPLAREHARAMTRLIQQYVDGIDANDDGRVEPVKMEGGLAAALQQAEAAGWLTL